MFRSPTNTSPWDMSNMDPCRTRNILYEQDTNRVVGVHFYVTESEGTCTISRYLKEVVLSIHSHVMADAAFFGQ